MAEIGDTLKERGKVYGVFSTQAAITLGLKKVLRTQEGWERLAPDMKEAAEMVCVKLARIVNGDPYYADNWHDIAGYATLVEKRLRGEDV